MNDKLWKRVKKKQYGVPVGRDYLQINKKDLNHSRSPEKLIKKSLKKRLKALKIEDCFLGMERRPEPAGMSIFYPMIKFHIYYNEKLKTIADLSEQKKVLEHEIKSLQDGDDD